MKINFIKMHGCGNDYIYFDCLDRELKNPSELSVLLSDRHFGVGGDGIVMICKSDVADAKMRMFNADGSEGKMCGNAIRCVGKYLFDRGIVEKTKVDIETLSGIKHLDLFVKDGTAVGAKVDMGAPVLEPTNIPVMLPEIVKAPLDVDGKRFEVTCVSMGNPHCIVFTDEDVPSMALEKIGPKFENHPVFPARVNTEFVNVVDRTHFVMRVWERGSGETLACGTGSCAVATACVLNGLADRGTNLEIKLVGGALVINWDNDGHVYMTGPATEVFSGEAEVPDELGFDIE